MIKEIIRLLSQSHSGKGGKCKSFYFTRKKNSIIISFSTLVSLKIYMIINFRVCRISQVAYKLARTLILIIKKIKNKIHACIYRLVCLY
jgi:hypothetical protein